MQDIYFYLNTTVYAKLSRPLVFMILCWHRVRPKKKELVLRPRCMYFLPRAFNFFFQPQNVKNKLKQFHVNLDFLIRLNSELYYVHLQSVCVYWYASQWQVSIHITLTKKWCDRRWQKGGKNRRCPLFCRVRYLFHGATIILPWNIVGGGGLQYRGLCWRSLHFYMQWKRWNRLGITCQVQRLLCQSVNRKVKTDSFDNVMLSVSVSEAVALFGLYLRFNLVEQSDNNNNRTLWLLLWKCLART